MAHFRRCTSSSGPARGLSSCVKPWLLAALCVVGSSSASAGFGQAEFLGNKASVDGARPAASSGGGVDASSAKHHHFALEGAYAAVSAPAGGSATHSFVSQQRLLGPFGDRNQRTLQEEEEDHDSHDEGEEHDSHEDEDHEDEEHDSDEFTSHDHDMDGYNDHTQDGGDEHDSDEFTSHDHDMDGYNDHTQDGGDEHTDHDSHDHDSHDHDEEHDSHDDVASGGVEGEADSHDSHEGHDHGDEEELALGGVGDVSVDRNKPWGRAIGAALLVNLATLVGVIFLGPGSKLLGMRGNSLSDRCHAILYSFAAGALLAAAFFLLLLESSHLIQGSFSDENDVSWRWGTSVLAGYMVSFVGDLVTSAFHKYTSRGSTETAAGAMSASNETTTIAEEEAGQPRVVSSTPQQGLEKPGLQQDIQTMMRVRFGVLVGDFLHNFVDGVFIGAGFMLCGEAKGWAIAAGTIYHELAQEFADFFTLTGIGGMKPFSALALNFVSGLSVVAGVIVVLASDVSDVTLGVLLAFGAGVYIHVAASESLPKVYASVNTIQDRLCALVAFMVGATTIGLVLLDHGHCTAGGAHAGHNH